MLSNQTVSISVPVPHVFAKDDHAVTTSLDVAGYFNKSHKDVLKAVRAIIESRQQLAGRNFAPGSYTDKNNQTRPMYYMDRKGFTLLVFGFTGPRALDFKIAYIDAFEALEAALQAIQQKPETNGIVISESEYKQLMDALAENAKIKTKLLDVYSALNALRECSYGIDHAIRMAGPLAEAMRTPMQSVHMRNVLQRKHNGLKA